MSENGKYLYFANQAGILQAWQVADDDLAPTKSPSLMPVLLPTQMPALSIAPTAGTPSIFILYDPCPALCARGAYDETLASEALLSILHS
jgi:hypothetical protein